MTDADIERIFTENKNLVYLVVNKRFPTFIHDDDVIQSGYIGLWKAITTYDDKKYAFSTYAYHCIYNEIGMYLRSFIKYTPFSWLVLTAIVIWGVVRFIFMIAEAEEQRKREFEKG